MATDKQTLTVQKRQFEGTVVSNSTDKTISVLVKVIKKDKKYNKQYTSSKKYSVHDGKNTAKVGDTVRFEECRPMSKTKRWRLIEVVKAA